MAKNSRLKKTLQTEMAQAQKLHQATQQPARVFKDFVYPEFRSSNFGAEERGVILESGKHPGVLFQSHFYTLAGWRYDGSTIRAAR